MNDSLKANTSDIERLVRASRAGDRDSFDELVRIHQRRVMGLAVRMLGNVDEAAEIVQDGFVKAYLKIEKLRKPERFEAWLLRIIANAAISRRKTAKIRAEKIEIVAHRENKKAPSPVDKQIGKELRQAIQQAMLKLSKKEVKAIALFEIENLTQEFID